MHDANFQDIKLLGPDELVDIRYADILANPMETLRSIYEKLHIDHPLPRTLFISFDETLRPAILAYQEAQKQFKVNQNQKLSKEERAVVADVWADYFAHYKYNP
ncbi:putative sulfotransferase [Nannochloropsis gaditana CCMP526]|uniref:putative sulfotransferase n=1 Tax=Nannochloropsis gaditana (strain CCMP526) TaxID=1093141 RepID=UPI00029F79E3|nr:putative sulfotransferase [Nannochloropsis gaditana CCMP526]XP_005854947.1 putative sulfotransferase [Nannochloropsis gaditana CCMP526]EKU21410.1 putative sulfotransferase [Nannochloropsis gaditana CCMP526]EKU23349.1 putative sulfotransferase [Nannochloropsis gaditana CCMP526]|eukprot:XP_005852483.1 putative sulfotransferase [Nannochloropsis gaditana CCMP526]